MKRDERRIAICDSAVTEFGRMGFHGATTAGIARGAGCSEPMLYKHFSDKQDLLRGALERSEQLAEAEIDAALSGGDPLTGWLEYIESGDLTHYHRMVCMRMLCATFPDGSDLQGHLRTGNERLMGRFRLALDRISALDPDRANDVDAEHVAWLWLGLTLAGAYGAAIEGPARFREILGRGRRLLLDHLQPKEST